MKNLLFIFIFKEGVDDLDWNIFLPEQGKSMGHPDMGEHTLLRSELLLAKFALK